MYIVKGKIVDSAGKSLSNINISVTDAAGKFLPINGENIGRISYKDGTFAIPVTNEEAFVTFSAVGYKRLTIPAAAASKKSVFKMQLDEQELPEVSINTGAPRPRAVGRPGPTMQLASMPKTSNKKYLIIAGAVAGIALIGFAIYFLTRKK